MHNFYKWIGIILGGATIFPCLNAHAATLPEDETKAVILAYHRIGEDAYPDTNLRTEQFIEHVKELEGGDYTILPLSDIITALTNATPLPKHTIAITFEGGHKSAQKNAFPLLLERKIPFTVFYASEKADQNNSEYLNWKELTKLRHNSGVHSPPCLPCMIT